MPRRSLVVVPLLVALATWAGSAGALPTPLVVLGAAGAALVATGVMLRTGSSFAADRLSTRVRHLQTERARIERLLDDLPTAVLLFSHQGLAYANPVARRLFGLAPDVLAVGAPAATPRMVLGAGDLAAAVGEARASGRTVEVEVTRDDRELVARASVSAEEVAVVVTDLTEIRRVQAMRRDFVTNASHELKTPVAGILALSESLDLALGRDPDRARSMVGRLQQEAARLAKLVRELLDLARLEEASGDVGRRVDLDAVVAGEVMRLQPVAAGAEVALRHLRRGPATLVARPHDMRLIVSNLLENAVRYNRPQGVVEVEVRRDQALVHLRVRDTGIGIPEADQARVFERFYRVDKGRSRHDGGTGLGLAIVRNAVGAQGGDISLRSTPDEGTTVDVVLPVTADP